MILLTLIFIFVALVLYVLLGGADFGAGIIEIFTGKRGINTISKAIAPVWEANHIWLIVVIVILFNAFPKVYSTVALYLHIPIFLVLIGIIFRGTAFTFRYYDPYPDKSHRYFTLAFKIFSVFTPLFLGITLGAIILGDMTVLETADFSQKFIFPWLNFFTFSLGIFLILLFAYLAAVYLTGEPLKPEEKKIYYTYTIRLIIALIIAGGIVFLTAHLYHLHLLQLYINSPVGITCLVIATLIIPLIAISLKKEKYLLSRILAGIQTASIIAGWFLTQYPVIVSIQNNMSLTINNSIAPQNTLVLLNLALTFGLLIVIPLLFYLFRTFKLKSE